MAQSVPAKPRKWRRRLKRAAIALGIVVVLGLLTCTVGWPWVNKGARAYAHHRLGNALDRAVETLPEIADYETLRALDVRGRNGIDQMDAGRADLMKLMNTHQSDEDAIYSSGWCGGLPDARLSSDYELLTAPQIGRIQRHRFKELLGATEFLAANARVVASYDCIVDVERRASWRTHASVDEYFGTLTTRVLLLAASGEPETACAELMTLVRLASMLDCRGSKEGAYYLTSVRNDVVEYAALPLMRAGVARHDVAVAILDRRWCTPGNDPKLWLNNAAAVYAYLREAHAVSPNIEIYSVKGEPVEDKSFPQFNLNYLPGHEQLMDVVVRNALDARAGVLDLRDPEWVKAYQFEFSSDWNPINGVVGCGRETMDWIVQAIDREDKLWAEIEAMSSTR